MSNLRDLRVPVRRFVRVCAVVAAFCAMASGILSQSPPVPVLPLPQGRIKHHASFPLPSGPWLFIESRAATNGSATLTVKSGANMVVTELPFTDVGGVVDFGSNHLLVSGAIDAGNQPEGRLCRIRINPDGSADILETSTIAATDPYAICWSKEHQLLAIMDVEGDEFKIAPLVGWPQGDNTPVLPPSTAFVNAIGISQLPALGGVHPWISEDDSTNYFLVGGDRIGGTARVFLDQGAWQVRGFGTESARRWFVQSSGQYHVSAPPDQISIRCGDSTIAGPVTFDVESLFTGEVVASGFVENGGDWVDLDRPNAFYELPGSPFTVVGGQDIAQAQAFRPLLRYGLPLTSTDLKPGAGLVGSAFLFVGSSKFLVGSPLSLSYLTAEPSSPVSVPAQLWVQFGYRGPGAPADPVVELGSQATLVSPIPIDIAHGQRSIDSGCGYPMSVPNDPGLEGVVMLFQFVFVSPVNPNDVAATDVFGSVILPAGAANALASPSAFSLPSAAGRVPRQQQSVLAFQQQSPWLQPDQQTTDRCNRLRALLNRGRR